MKQITADLQKLVKAYPNRSQSVKIAAVNSNITIGIQYDGQGMYRALRIDPLAKRTTALTPWMNSLEVLEQAITRAGIELAEQHPVLSRPRKSIFLYVDGNDMGVDVVDLALQQNMMVDDTKKLLEEGFAPAQVTFKVETR